KDDAPKENPDEPTERAGDEPVDPLKPMRERCTGGDGEACLRVGRALESGAGVVVDLAGAREAFRRGCDGGVLAACTKLGARVSIDEKDTAGAEALFRRACDGNDGAGCERLAVSATGEARLSFYSKACLAG